QLDEQSQQMQTEQKNERARDRSQRRAVLAEESADGAGRGAKCDEDRGKSDDKGERRGEQSRARRLTLAQLLHADARQHRDVSGHQRQNARRQERNQPREKSSS